MIGRILKDAELGDAAAARRALREFVRRGDTAGAGRMRLILDLLRRFTPQQIGELGRRKIYERHLSEFARAAWHVVEPGRRYVHGWHIDAICDHLEGIACGEISDLVINIPPRHMKSLLVSVLFPAWEWTTDPGKRYICTSHSAELATRDSLKCRRVIQSAWYQRLWGPRERRLDHLRSGAGGVELCGDQNRKTRFENTATGYRLSGSVGGGAGTGEGGDRVICDDPHKVSDADSPKKLEAARLWWFEEMSSRDLGKHTAFVVIGQRVHKNDLTGHILASGEAVHLRLPAEYEARTTVVVEQKNEGELAAATPPHTEHVSSVPAELGRKERKTLRSGRRVVSKWRRFKDPRSKEGMILWPQRFNRAYLRRMKKKLGSHAYAGQYQQRPGIRGGSVWEIGWFRRWTRSSLPDKFDHLYVSADMTFGSTSDTASFVVFQLWGVVSELLYLLDQVRDRMSFPDMKRRFIAFCEKHPQAKIKFVENKAGAVPLNQDLKRITISEFNTETQKRITRSVRGIVLVDPKKLGSKIVRAYKVAPVIEAGCVYLPADGEEPWVEELADEIEAFPLSAADDQVDTISQAIAQIEARRGKSLQFRITTL